MSVDANTPVLRVSGLTKTFCLHLQDEARIPVFDALGFTLNAGEAVALNGPSGVGKSSFLKLVYGTYLAAAGEIAVMHRGGWVDIANAEPRQVLDIRRETLGYVTQFLRVIPRVPTLDIVAEPLIERGESEEAARARARDLLNRLNIPETLWSLSPLTFSGGEQQRVNIARGFAASFPIMLLDEPTASLDAVNRQTVIDLIGEAVAAGSAVIGIFHSKADREQIASRAFELTPALAA